MSTTEATMAAIERFNDAFNQHDVDGLTKLMTDDVVFENTGDQRFEGQEAVCGFFRRFFESTPMAWFDTEDMFAVGDRCVVRWILTFNREEPERGRVRGCGRVPRRRRSGRREVLVVKSAEVVRKLGLQPGGS
jgi:limonene-1,2-epoxide hydrolase